MITKCIFLTSSANLFVEKLVKQLGKHGKVGKKRPVEIGGRLGMVKGVSKQVVEILHTENEYFEKVILFVNPEKAGTERKELKKQADYFMHAYLQGKRGFRRRVTGKIWKNVCLTAAGVLAGVLLSALVLIL